jgi:hypothetical protein
MMSQTLCPLMLTDEIAPIVEGACDCIADDAALLVSIARRIPAAWEAWQRQEQAQERSRAPFISMQRDTHYRALRTVICPPRDAFSGGHGANLWDPSLIASLREQSVRPFPSALPFVGFVSQARFDLPQHRVEAIARADRELVAWLGTQSHILAYASLDLGAGAWCNLVLLRAGGAGDTVSALPQHRVAAYELAPRYYRAIRLHHGMVAVERERPMVWLERTKFYTFYDHDLPPQIRTEIYTAAAASRTALQAVHHSAAHEGARASARREE